ncbi:MAG: DUF1858 domain-containing protein [Nanoarchaeota archaeon]|nr:DUF1858 domain-containing protein [DPANN group archaeon]MBL7116533.1 DUF1858 domain-containing protein [Nanoarchaeota archaeon]
MKQKQKVAKQKITKDMTIGEVAQNFPAAIEILLAEGVHCVGCGAAFFETIEQGLMVHGKSEKEIDKVLKRMNEHVAN